MELDFDTCYRAIQSRDARFDGRFFTAVTSTGIYCRPICPAQTPLPKNIRFYPSATAAVAAGFRACRRCRPDAAPSSPDWNVRADLVGRALRLIAEGAVDTDRISGLARRLAVSPRHLHREVLAEVGAGPLALARTRRTQTARLLIDQTGMSLSEIAFAAGFGSIRQFNDSMRAAFGCNPTDLRRREEPAPAGSGAITVRLSHRLPLDAVSLLDYLRRRAVPGVEEVRDGCYRRTIALGRSAGTLELQSVATASTVRLRLWLDDLRDLTLVVQRCRQLLDLDVDPAAVTAVLGADPVLAPFVRANPGLRVPGTVDGWEIAVRAVLGQQVSVVAARTLVGRLVRSLGSLLAAPDRDLTHHFPRPEVVAEADLNDIGITRARAGTLRALAAAVAGGAITLDRGADREEVENRLLALPGIGPWTASYVAMRALGDPDAFLPGDLGVRRAAEALGLDPNPRALTGYAERWRPWRAYAVLYLWQSLSAAAPITHSRAVQAPSAIAAHHTTHGSTEQRRKQMISSPERTTSFPPIDHDTVVLGQAETPLGEFGAVCTARGLACLSFPADSLDGCTAWVRRNLPGARIVHEHDALTVLSTELTAYLNGSLHQFSVPLDLHGTPFQMDVWQALQRIPYGQVRSYAEIARDVGRPKAVRAVGMANHANPVPIIVPCHRVIGSNRTLTGYGGGLDLKERLLRLEGVVLGAARP